MPLVYTHLMSFVSIRLLLMSSSALNLENILKETLEFSPDSFGIFDKNQTLVYCNSTFSNMFGVTREAAIGRTHTHLLEESWRNKKGIKIECDDFSEWIKRLEKLHDEKSLNQFEADLRDGRWFKMTRINLDSGFSVFFGVDITELKETQKSLQEANKKILTLANTDQLTGLYNRRAFCAVSGEMVEIAIRDKQTFSLLLIDFDLFKEINDQFGHDAGDKVLQEFATISKVFFAQYKSLCRIGGEEFVVLLPDLDLPDSHIMAEKFRDLVANHTFYLAHSNQHIQITVSIGVSQWRMTDKVINDLLQRADSALYKAKAAGRNQVFKIGH